jgi:ubiquinone biosynthesis monooxygenase Coq7
MGMRQYSVLDKICLEIDRGLKTLSGIYETTGRPNPAAQLAEPDLTGAERKHAAGLMRVNHTGEVCAQALYQGQALTARVPDLQQQLMHAAEEESDHLAWCRTRLTELNSRPSYLDPFWYVGSYVIGAAAGLISDKISLGFLAETEQQVERHLNSHLEELPVHDQKSRAIVIQMRTDEIAHGKMAHANGAADLPTWTKTVMRYQAKLMTTTAYWL